jgi:hypothetical protein
MGKYTKTEKVNKSKEVYPSDYGSHASMLVNDNGGQRVTCKDGRGVYVTERKALDNGMMDYHRSVSLEERETTLREYYNEDNCDSTI